MRDNTNKIENTIIPPCPYSSDDLPVLLYKVTSMEDLKALSSDTEKVMGAFMAMRAEKFRHTNYCLYYLIQQKKLFCDVDCVLMLSNDHTTLFLIDEGWDEYDSKELGTQQVIDITDCVFQALKGHYAFPSETFKDFYNSVCLNIDCLKQYLAGSIWGLKDAKDTMNIKTIRTVEELCVNE